MRSIRTIGFEITSLSNLIKREIGSNMQQNEKNELTGMHALIVGFLFDNLDRDMFQRDIEAEFHIRRSTATGMLQRMEKSGLLLRVAISRDARLKKLVLTEKAVGIHKNVMQAIDRMEQKLSQDLSEEEVEAFFAITAKIKRNIECAH